MKTHILKGPSAMEHVPGPMQKPPMCEGLAATRLDARGIHNDPLPRGCVHVSRAVFECAHSVVKSNGATVKASTCCSKGRCFTNDVLLR